MEIFLQQSHNWKVRKVALKCLAVLIPCLSPNEVSQLLQIAQLKLVDNEWFVRAMVLNCLGFCRK
ncbi:hypothetical protein [Legionella beliardensis]|uniref:hypothetical protein n=1 Tax=Legionella beliardensis TaxID=91822 RepID=UPI000E1B57C8